MVATPILVFARENATQSKVIVTGWSRVEELKQIQAANEGAIFKGPGVVGIGIGFMTDGGGPWEEILATSPPDLQASSAAAPDWE